MVKPLLPLTLISLFCSRKSRTTFDTTETRKEFGPVVIDYTKVQSKVSLKYDSWHKEVLSKFGSLLGNDMSQFHSVVSKVCANTLFFQVGLKLLPFWSN